MITLSSFTNVKLMSLQKVSKKKQIDQFIRELEHIPNVYVTYQIYLHAQFRFNPTTIALSRT